MVADRILATIYRGRTVAVPFDLRRHRRATVFRGPVAKMMKRDFDGLEILSGETKKGRTTPKVIRPAFPVDCVLYEKVLKNFVYGCLLCILARVLALSALPADDPK